MVASGITPDNQKHDPGAHTNVQLWLTAINSLLTAGILIAAILMGRWTGTVDARLAVLEIQMTETRAEVRSSRSAFSP